MESGVLSTGGPWTKIVYTDMLGAKTRVGIADFNWSNWNSLKKLSVLFLPYGTPHDYLGGEEQSTLLHTFLKTGGVVVAFGEIEPDDWASEYVRYSFGTSLSDALTEGAEFTRDAPRTIEEVVGKSGSDVFKKYFGEDLSAEKVKGFFKNWKSTTHGFFTVVPNKTRVVMKDEKGRNIMVMTRPDDRGLLILTTIDADYHTLYGVEGAEKFVKAINESITVFAKSEPHISEMKASRKKVKPPPERPRFIKPLFVLGALLALLIPGVGLIAGACQIELPGLIYQSLILLSSLFVGLAFFESMRRRYERRLGKF